MSIFLDYIKYDSVNELASYLDQLGFIDSVIKEFIGKKQLSQIQGYPPFHYAVLLINERETNLCPSLEMDEGDYYGDDLLFTAQYYRKELKTIGLKESIYNNKINNMIYPPERLHELNSLPASSYAFEMIAHTNKLYFHENYIDVFSNAAMFQ